MVVETPSLPNNAANCRRACCGTVGYIISSMSVILWLMKLWRLTRKKGVKGSFVITVSKDMVLGLGWDEGDELLADRIDGELVIKNLTKRPKP